MKNVKKNKKDFGKKTRVRLADLIKAMNKLLKVFSVKL